MILLGKAILILINYSVCLVKLKIVLIILFLEYIDLSSKGFNCGRIQLSMVYNGPSINQGMGNYGNYNPNVYFPRNSPKNINPSYGWGNMPNNNFNQGQGWGMNQYQPNTNWNNPPYNQYNQGDQGINPNQNKGSLWK